MRHLLPTYIYRALVASLSLTSIYDVTQWHSGPHNVATALSAIIRFTADVTLIAYFWQQLDNAKERDHDT